MTLITLPRRSKGRPSANQKETFEKELDNWCAVIQQINSTLDFRVSSRGWCYILEEKCGLLKGDFDIAQKTINDCRKSGKLPLDICADDDGRSADWIETLDDDDIKGEASCIIDYVYRAHNNYTPISFWDFQSYYVEIVTEKIDLKSLFSSVCHEYNVGIQNASGWNDINGRAALMRRFSQWERKGKECVLLYCGDHDPGGLHISNFLRSNFEDLSGAVGWHPDSLIIERFGLDYDFIESEGLTWIDNLETASGKFPLDHPDHQDHWKSYVQDYLRRFGARKCEANALVTRPQAGRRLCREAIHRYIDVEGIREYRSSLNAARENLRREIVRQLGEGSAI